MVTATGMARAATFVVATTGSDGNPGTIAQPWRSIQHAADVMSPGDSVLVRGGTYDEGVFLTRSGAPGAPITFRAFPGETAILLGASDTYAGFSTDSDKDISDITIDGFTIRGFPNFGIVAWSTNDRLTLANLIIRDNGATGIRLSNSDGTRVDNVLMEGNTGGFDCTPILPGAGTDPGCTNLYIANMTGYAYLATFGDSEGDTPVSLHNAIFYNDNPEMGGTLVWFSSGVSLTADNNLYYNPYRTDAVICASFPPYDYECFSADDLNGLTDHAWIEANAQYADPRFTEAAAADFSLQAASPAIDAGTAEGGPAVDLAGRPRPQADWFDVGAYENGDDPATPSARPTRTPTSTRRPTVTATPSVTRRSTATRTRTWTRRPTSTPTSTRTLTATRRPSPTRTATRTRRPSATRTATWTRRPTTSRTPTRSATRTWTRRATSTVTSTRTRPPSATRTATATSSRSRTPTRTRTALPTRTATPSATATRTATAVPPAATATPTGGESSGVPVIGGCGIFPTDNPWNRDISGDPVDPNSANYIASINLGAQYLHADFGSPAEYGIPFVVVPESQPLVPITYTEYGDESDPGPFPVPANAPREAGSDRHVLVLQSGACRLYELYHAVKDTGGPGWFAGSGAFFDLGSNALRPDSWTSCDQAGLPILPGLVRYDEVAAGEIRHAVRFTVWRPQRAWVHPATHYGTSSNLNDPPMGTRLRLKAGYDVSRFSGQARVVLNALKRYGMFVADTGSSWFITGATDPRWDDEDLDQLKTVPGSAFEVVQLGTIYRP